MNKNEYMLELESALRHLPNEEREDALSYYREYFEDAGPGKESEVIEELGDPKTVASQIITNVAIKRLDEPKRAAKKGLSTLWIVILALCAAPVGLPVLLAFLLFGLALVIFVVAIVAACMTAGVTFTFAGVISLVAGIFFLPSQTANGIFVLGSALCETGLGVFLILGACICCKGIFGGLARQIKKLLAGGNKR